MKSSRKSSKRCPDCGIEKPRTGFYRDRSNLDGLAGYCKTCQRDQKRVWQLNNPEKHAEAGRRISLRRKFGLTVADYEEILQEQKGVCKICGKPCATGNRLAVDHNHDTGQVRGLLCYRCNTHLGWLECHKDEVVNYLPDLNVQGYLHEHLKKKKSDE